MAKKLNDPSKVKKNIGTKNRGLGMPINPESLQKEQFP